MIGIEFIEKLLWREETDLIQCILEGLFTFSRVNTCSVYFKGLSKFSERLYE